MHEYGAEEFRGLCQRSFDHVELLGVFHARKLRLHDWALRLGWDRVHPALGISERFYGWFVAAISTRDFRVRAARLEGALDFLAVLR